MAQIEEILFPIDDSLQSVVKLEPLDATELQGDGSTKYPEDRLGEKTGEIFRISEKDWRLVCVHCSREFSLFAQFTAHIEKHLRTMAMADTSNAIKPEAMVNDSWDPVAENWQHSDSDSEDGAILTKSQEKTKITSHNTVRCPKCKKSYSTVSNMRRHLRECNTHGDELQNQVSSLDEDEPEENKKDANHVGENDIVFPCSKCGKCYSSMSNVKRHLRVGHGVKSPKSSSHQCSVCEEQFTFKRQLHHHMQSHKPEKVNNDDTGVSKDGDSPDETNEIHPCPECGKVYSTLGNMRRHLNKHLAKFFSCSICNKKFTDNGYVREHMRIIHKIDECYWCKICGEGFKYKRHMERHQRTHTDDITEMSHDSEMSFECHMCHAPIENRLKLKYHLRGHWNTLYPCDICGQSFKFQNSLARHKWRHEKNKINLIHCEHCPVSFTSHKQHRLHLRKDHDFPIYQSYRRLMQKEPDVLQCDYCQKTFHRKTNLRLHMMTHVPEPYRVKYTCHICGLAFLHQSNLTRHVTNHDRSNKFTCQYCHKSFR